MANHVFLIVLSVLYALGTVLSVKSVGKPRTPLTRSQAEAVVVINTLIVVALFILFW